MAKKKSPISKNPQRIDPRTFRILLEANDIGTLLINGGRDLTVGQMKLVKQKAKENTEKTLIQKQLEVASMTGWKEQQLSPGAIKVSKRVDDLINVKATQLTNQFSSISANKLVPESQSDDVAVDVLGQIYDLLTHANELKKVQSELDRNALQIKNLEEEQRNQEIIKALRGISSKTEKPKIKEEKVYQPKKTEPVKAETQRVDRPQKVERPVEPPKQQTAQPTTVPNAPAPTARPAATTPIIPGAAKIATGIGMGAAVASAIAGISITGETGAKSSADAIKKSGQVVPNDPKPGVFSYGVFGMNSKSGTINQFIEQSPEFQFTDKPGTKKFNEEWANYGKTRAKEFFDAQMMWYNNNLLSPLRKELQQKLPANLANDNRVLAYMADRRIQYGNVLEKSALKYSSESKTPQEFISNMTQYDLEHIQEAFKTYLQEHPENKAGLEKRVQNRQSKSLQIPNDSGNQLNNSSQENKDMKNQLQQTDSSAQVNINNSTTNSGGSSSSTKQKGDDRPAIVRKSQEK